MDDIKDRLNQFRKMMIYAAECFDELDAVETVLKSPNMNGMPSGGSGDAMERLVIRIVGARDRAEKARKDVMKMMDEVEDEIDSLADFEQRSVLRLYYVKGYKWEEVAVRLHRSIRTIHRIHGQALNELRRAK